MGGGLAEDERKGGRRGGYLGWRCSLIVEILEVFPVRGVARGVFLQFSRFLVFFFSFFLSLVFSFSRFLSPLPPLYNVDVDLHTYFLFLFDRYQKR